MLELHQRYRVRPAFMKGEGTDAKYMVGVVVYIHPEGRYAVLAFEGPHGTARESFFPEELTERNRMLGKRRDA